MNKPLFWPNGQKFHARFNIIFRLDSEKEKKPRIIKYKSVLQALSVNVDENVENYET